MSQAKRVLAAVILGMLLQQPAAAEPTFERDVLPILTSHCLACHGGVTQKNALDMRTSAGLLQGGASGPAVMPGQVAKSLLWTKIFNDDMPRNENKISATNKETIRRWIETGARSSEVARRFAPPAKAGSPAAVAKKVDQIIGDKLKFAKVPASPLADDPEFLRRVTLDITGRIPSAEQAKSFLASAAPDRRAKLIDSLLAQPEYGQNFATEWISAFRRISMNTTGRRLGMLEDYTRKLGQGLQDGRGWEVLMREALTYTGPYALPAPQRSTDCRVDLTTRRKSL